MSLDVVKSRPLCSDESMRAPSSVSLTSRSPVLVSENFPVMSFVGRFPSRTEKLNAKVLSDIQSPPRLEKGIYAHAAIVRLGRAITVTCFTTFSILINSYNDTVRDSRH